jgi:hypothetical protein
VAKVQPYDDAPTNALYHLLFCDDYQAIRDASAEIEPGIAKLFDTNVDEKAVRAIADDTRKTPRLRALAFQRLREAKKKTPAKLLLGAILEIPMDNKPETFAAFVDGGIRYIDTRGKVSYADGAVPQLIQAHKKMMEAARDLADSAKLSNQPRSAVPRDKARLTILMSDGPYIVEGTMEKLMKDKKANAFIESSGLLLKTFIDAALKQADKTWAKVEAEQSQQ